MGYFCLVTVYFNRVYLTILKILNFVIFLKSLFFTVLFFLLFISINTNTKRLWYTCRTSCVQLTRALRRAYEHYATHILQNEMTLMDHQKHHSLMTHSLHQNDINKYVTLVKTHLLAGQSEPPMLSAVFCIPWPRSGSMFRFPRPQMAENQYNKTHICHCVIFIVLKT